MRQVHPCVRVDNGTFVLIAVALCCLPGCESGGRAKVYPVEGKVVVSGQPAANAQLAFHPQGERVSRTPLPVGTTGPDGAYRLTTYAAGDGAPAGEYAVTIVWPDDSIPHDDCADHDDHDRLHGRYADPAKTQLRATIRPEHNEVTLRATLDARP